MRNLEIPTQIFDSLIVLVYRTYFLIRGLRNHLQINPSILEALFPAMSTLVNRLSQFSLVDFMNMFGIEKKYDLILS